MATPALAVGDEAYLSFELDIADVEAVEAETHDPLDLFYGVRVTRVRHVGIPDRFIKRGGHSLSHPTVVGSDEYGTEDMREVSAVSDEAGTPAFSLLELELLPPGAGPARPTFLGT